MRKGIILLVILVVLIGLTACANQEAELDDEETVPKIGFTYDPPEDQMGKSAEEVSQEEPTSVE